MRIPESIKLVAAVITQDQYGVQHRAETEKKVYGYIDSVTGSEKFNAGTNGINPEFRVTMTDLDYSGETVLSWQGQRYSIYRTYRTNNGTIELYCERKGGRNGEEDPD